MRKVWCILTLVEKLQSLVPIRRSWIMTFRWVIITSFEFRTQTSCSRRCLFHSRGSIRLQAITWTKEHSTRGFFFSRGLKPQWKDNIWLWPCIMNDWTKCQWQYWRCQKEVWQLFKLEISQETYSPAQLLKKLVEYQNIVSFVPYFT